MVASVPASLMTWAHTSETGSVLAQMRKAIDCWLKRGPDMQSDSAEMEKEFHEKE